MNELYKLYKLRIIGTYIVSFIALVILLLGMYFFFFYSDGSTAINLKTTNVSLSVSTKNMGVVFMLMGVALVFLAVKSMPKLSVKDKFSLEMNDDD